MSLRAARFLTARLRRATGGGEGHATHSSSEPPGAPAIVPLTVRATSSDDADVRLLIEVHMRPLPGPTSRLDHVAHALVEPAAARWIRRHALCELRRTRTVRIELEDLVRDELAGLGADLVRIDVVAVEHLLVSPSAEAARRHREPDDGAR